MPSACFTFILAQGLCLLLAARGTAPPSHYELFPGAGYYRLAPRLTSWRDAWAHCDSEGAHLAVISTAEEAQVLKALYSYQTELPPYAHIGVHGFFRKGRYHTIFGKPLKVTKYIFLETKPVLSPEQTCVSFSRSGKLAVGHCDEPRPFFCEFPLPETPLVHSKPAIQRLLELVQAGRSFAEEQLHAVCSAPSGIS